MAKTTVRKQPEVVALASVLEEPPVTFRRRGVEVAPEWLADPGPVAAQRNRPVEVVSIVDAASGRRCSMVRRQTIADYLRRSGDITEQQHQACGWWADMVEEVLAVGAVRATDPGAVSGGGFDPLTFFRLHHVETAFGARRSVDRVLDTLGGPDSLPSRLLWHCIGLGLGVREWIDTMAREGERGKHRQHIVGVLRAAIEVLTAHAPRSINAVDSGERR